VRKTALVLGIKLWPPKPRKPQKQAIYTARFRHSQAASDLFLYFIENYLKKLQFAQLFVSRHGAEARFLDDLLYRTLIVLCWFCNQIISESES